MTVPGHFGNEDKLTLKDANFKLAFSLFDEFDKKTLNSTEFVQWTAYHKKALEDESSYEQIKFHECTEEDYK